MTRSQKIASTFSSALFCLLLLSAAVAHAQQFEVIHTFMYSGDGAYPYTGLTLYHGKFFGTTYSAIFSLQSENGSWVLNPIFDFPGSPYSGGISPYGKVVVGPDGALYGTTYDGGLQDGCAGNGCGVVYRLQPPSTFCRSVQCFWTETVLHTFTGGADGAQPYSEVTFDQAGNMYGTASSGGSLNCNSGCGVVYKMTPSAGGWTQSIIYNFTGGDAGQYPSGGLIFDHLGNLYGAAGGGGTGSGIIYKLTPSNGGWTETVLHNFQGATDGGGPTYTLTADASGNLYGVTYGGGPQGGGTAYEYSPSNGGTFTVLHAFGISYGEPATPSGTPIFDSAGNLYGTTAYGGYLFTDFGSVYKLSPSGGGWTETDLYVFEGGRDGMFPFCSPVFDAQGNLYGTASQGGIGDGTVWRITP
jgi:uncharacterized repeat protein (TIGR03803 family)